MKKRNRRKWYVIYDTSTINGQKTSWGTFPSKRKAEIWQRALMIGDPFLLYKFFKVVLQ